MEGVKWKDSDPGKLRVVKVRKLRYVKIFTGRHWKCDMQCVLGYSQTRTPVSRSVGTCRICHYATAGDAGSPPGKLCVLLGKTSLCLLLLMIRYLCVQQHAATCICNWIGSSSVQIVPKGCSPFLSSCLYTFRYKRLETRWWMSLVDVRLKLIRRRRRRRRRGGEAVVAVSSSRSRSRDRTAKEQNLE